VKIMITLAAKIILGIFIAGTGLVLSMVVLGTSGV